MTNSILPVTVQAAENKLRRNIISPAVNISQLRDFNQTDIYLDNVVSESSETGVVTKIQGRDYVNSIFPDEIEYYACALELIDSNGKTIEFFSFPVMPGNMKETTQNNAAIKKTMAGVVINKSESFVPIQLSISGDFGRRFRNVYGSTAGSAIAGVFAGTQRKNLGNIDASNGNEKGVFFDTDNKTGYGSCKILERILRKSMKADSNKKPYNLFFYNLAFNSFYNVEFESFDFNQSKEKNMIWSYTVSFRAVSPASSLLSKQTLKSSISNLRNLSELTNEAKKQSTSLSNISLSNSGKMSVVSEILYGETKKINNIADRFSKNNPQILEAFKSMRDSYSSNDQVGTITKFIGANNSSIIQNITNFKRRIL